MTEKIFLIILLFAAIFLIRYLKKKKAWKYPKLSFPNEWRIILNKHVIFYNNLNDFTLSA